jgi:hypothetical protein
MVPFIEVLLHTLIDALREGVEKEEAADTARFVKMRMDATGNKIYPVGTSSSENSNLRSAICLIKKLHFCGYCIKAVKAIYAASVYKLRKGKTGHRTFNLSYYGLFCISLLQ